MAAELFPDDRTLANFSDTGSLRGEELPDLLREHGVRYLHLQLCDLLGTLRTVEIPAAQVARAVSQGVLFDGAGGGSFVRLDEADIRLMPDPATLRLVPWSAPARRAARLLCDARRADGSPFEGDARSVLRRTVSELEPEGGYQPRVALALEYYLLPPDGTRHAPLAAAAGEPVRHDVLDALLALGVEVEAAFADPGTGQHRIELGWAHPLTAADWVVTLRDSVTRTAQRHGLQATFLPKPFLGRSGSGMHARYQLLRDGGNAFFDPESRDGPSETLRFFVGGLLRHARGCSAVTNPLVNSYKRLVPGYEAPVHVAWSSHHRTALARVPTGEGPDTLCEVRIADAAANPYLMLAVQLAAGLDGLRSEMDPGEPIRKNLEAMSPRERQRMRIERVPRDLAEALEELERDRLVRATLGEHIFSHFATIKQAEWAEYAQQVHAWEVERGW